MSEIAEAAQIVMIMGQALAGTGKFAYKTGELGVMIIKAIMNRVEKERLAQLSGEVPMDKLERFEARKLSVARFENVNMEELEALLDQYDVPYSLMPSAEVNGIEYTQIAFGIRNTDRINAIIQTLNGKGEVITSDTQPPYISHGRVSLDVLYEQDGNLLMYQFDEASREQLTAALEGYMIKYSFMPDLNVDDEKFEIAFPPKQLAQVQMMLKKLQIDGMPIEMEEYIENASPDLVRQAAEEYDKQHILPTAFEITEKDGNVFEISAPKGAVITNEQDEERPLISPTGQYALPVPQTEIKEYKDDPDKIKFEVKKEKEYEVVFPNGTSETKTGSQLIDDMREAIEKAKEQLEKLLGNQTEKIEEGIEEASKTLKL